MTISDELTKLDNAKQNLKSTLIALGHSMDSVEFLNYYKVLLSIPTNVEINYYVSAKGNDSNDGKSLTTPNFPNEVCTSE